MRNRPRGCGCKDHNPHRNHSTGALEEVGIRVIQKLRSNAQPTLAVNFALELRSGQVTNVVREIQQALADLELTGKSRSK